MKRPVTTMPGLAIIILVAMIGVPVLAQEADDASAVAGLSRVRILRVGERELLADGIRIGDRVESLVFAYDETSDPPTFALTDRYDPTVWPNDLDIDLDGATVVLVGDNLQLSGIHVDGASYVVSFSPLPGDRWAVTDVRIAHGEDAVAAADPVSGDPAEDLTDRVTDLTAELVESEQVRLTLAADLQETEVVLAQVRQELELGMDELEEVEGRVVELTTALEETEQARHDAPSSERVAALERSLASAGDERRDLQTALQDAGDRVRELERQLLATETDLAARTADLQAAQSRLPSSSESANFDSASGPAVTDEPLSAERRAIDAELAATRDRLAAVEAQVAALRSALTEQATTGDDRQGRGTTPRSPRVPPTAMSGVTLSDGFARVIPLAGNWRVTGGRAEQLDPTARYAKLAVPVSLDSVATSISLTGSSAASDRTGYGIHVFASGSRRANGYGYGSSYLVWLTRDEEFYRSDSTYLQLYRSVDDTRMVQLASVAIGERISDALNVDVIYTPTGGRIEVRVNGTPRLGYDVGPVPLRSGDEVVVRALGAPVTVSRLIIRTDDR